FIGSGGHWNSLLVHQEATLAQRPVLVAVEFVSPAFRGAFGVSGSGLRQHGRHDAFWSYDERGAFGGGEPEFGPVKAEQFEIVTHSLRSGRSKVGSLDHLPLADTLGQIGNFLVGIELFDAELLRPFER